jgi:ParB family transcriptional regulator, chromosome partitioning protein
VRHSVKCWPEYYREVAKGNKLFEVRKNDRNYKTGDLLTLMEWNPALGSYTGNSVTVKIGYILAEHAGLKPGFICFQIAFQYPHGAF